MDIATLLGLVLGFVMVIFGIISSGGVSAITDSFLSIYHQLLLRLEALSHVLLPLTQLKNL